jgi:hypothetical protein
VRCETLRRARRFIISTIVVVAVVDHYPSPSVSGSPHFQFVTSPPSSATVTLDSSIRTKADLLSTLARALHIPDSFGHDWDALVDHLSDLSFHAGTDATVDHASLPALPPADLAHYLGCLAAALDRLHSREVECSGLRVYFRELDRARIEQILA